MTALTDTLQLLRERECEPREYREGKWISHCPAHNDPSPSLSLTSNDNGSHVLLYCFAGCSYGDVLAALDSPPSALFDDDPKPPKGTERQPEELPDFVQVEEWARTLQRSPDVLGHVQRLRGWSKATLGNLLIGFEARRLTIPVYSDKGDLVNLIRYDPSGKTKPKSKALRGHPRALYPTPRSGVKTLWIVEGEPDAISAHELGIRAVGLPGVHSWRQEYAQRFSGHSVVIALDCDEPGRECATRIHTDLRSAGVRSAIFDLAPERTDGYDLTDALLEAVESDSVENARQIFGSITKEHS